ncbi:hypothetical protein TNCV_3641171 [Trichonephila clavipes]|nr:hypothetical protein TNCV_3641171 [Trichonephila clavipes]
MEQKHVHTSIVQHGGEGVLLREGVNQQKGWKDFLCLDNEHIFGGDQRNTPEIMDEILTTTKDLELEVNEDDIEELIIEHEYELTTEELQEILNEEHQETQR